MIQLTEDLAAQASFQGWVMDLSSPGLLEMMNQKMGDAMTVPMPHFSSPRKKAPQFFEKYDWKKLEVHSMLKTARKPNRLPLMLRVMSYLLVAGSRTLRRQAALVGSVFVWEGRVI